MDTAENVAQIRKLRRERLQWSTLEDSFRNRQIFRKKDFADSSLNLSACADEVFRQSVFGVYLKSFNEKEQHDSFLNENKLGITQWDVFRYSESESKKFTEKNMATEDLYGLLLNAVKNLEVIDWGYLYDTLVTLRLSNCNVS